MAAVRDIDPVTGPALQAEYLLRAGRLQGVQGFGQDSYVKMVGEPCLVLENNADLWAGGPIPRFVDEQPLVVGSEQDGGPGLVSFAGKKDREMFRHQPCESPFDTFA